MIRPTTPADTDSLVELARDTGVFKPMEIETLREVLDDYHRENAALGHRCFTLLDEAQIIGFAYHAPAAMTDRTWYLYWIAVRKDVQARGAGGRLLKAVEDDVAAAGGRILVIETSSLPHYEPTRRFYLKNGYDKEAVLRDFYTDGDDMVVFRKRMKS